MNGNCFVCRDKRAKSHNGFCLHCIVIVAFQSNYLYTWVYFIYYTVCEDVIFSVFSLLTTFVSWWSPGLMLFSVSYPSLKQFEYGAIRVQCCCYCCPVKLWVTDNHRNRPGSLFWISTTETHVMRSSGSDMLLLTALTFSAHHAFPSWLIHRIWNWWWGAAFLPWYGVEWGRPWRSNV